MYNANTFSIKTSYQLVNHTKNVNNIAKIKMYDLKDLYNKSDIKHIYKIIKKFCSMKIIFILMIPLLYKTLILYQDLYYSIVIFY